jgi:hypothetical protein
MPHRALGHRNILVLTANVASSDASRYASSSAGVKTACQVMNMRETEWGSVGIYRSLVLLVLAHSMNVVLVFILALPTRESRSNIGLQGTWLYLKSYIEHCPVHI